MKNWMKIYDHDFFINKLKWHYLISTHLELSTEPKTEQVPNQVESILT